MNYKIILIIIFIIIVSLGYYHYIHLDSVIYIDDFLNKQDYSELLNHIHNLQDLKPNNNGLLSKKLNDQNIYDMFYNKQNLNKISNLVGKKVYQSKIPIEYRIYNKSQGMFWHTDVLLYEIPQYEIVYTLNNTSDSETEYIDHWGMKHNVWTKPNSLMIVKADSYKHGVKPVTKGTREILKMIYTPTHTINETNKMAYNHALT